MFISILKLSQSTETIHRGGFILSSPCAVPPNPHRMETLQILPEELCEFGLAHLVLWNPSGIGYDWSGWVAKLLLNQNLRRRELCKTYLVLVIGPHPLEKLPSLCSGVLTGKSLQQSPPPHFTIYRIRVQVYKLSTAREHVLWSFMSNKALANVVTTSHRRLWNTSTSLLWIEMYWIQRLM